MNAFNGKRILPWLGTSLLAALVLTAGVAAGAAQTSKNSAEQPAAQSQPLPPPARDGGYLQRGGTDIGQGYGYGGEQFGRGTADFGKNLMHGEVSDAGKAMGRGAAGFGKGVGVGTARGFKSFGHALAHLGKKIDHAVSH